MVLIMALLMILLIVIGMPIGFVLYTIGAVGLFWVGGWVNVEGILGTAPFRSVGSIALSAVPLFIFMAEVISRANIVKELFTAAQRWLERLPGGLAQATILASAAMGAICGSSGAAAATMAKVSIPELIKHGYNKAFAAGVVTVSGTLAIMIPPSITFVLYGVITENSIGKLLMAGIFPGLVTAFMYCVGILVWGKLKPGTIPPTTREFTMKDKLSSLRPLSAFAVLVFLVLFTLYSGLATATESAAIGALGAIIIALCMRRINLKGIYDAGFATVKTSAMIFMIIAGAMVLGYFLTLTQLPQKLIAAMAALNVPNAVIFAMLIVCYLILGCMMDATAILFITLPLTYPLAMSMGYDPIWFGVVIVKVIEVGLVTPPVGLNAFIVAGTAKIPLADVFRGTGMMLCCEILSLAVIIAFPVLSTYLPSMMEV